MTLKLITLEDKEQVRKELSNRSDLLVGVVISDRVNFELKPFLEWLKDWYGEDHNAS